MDKLRAQDNFEYFDMKSLASIVKGVFLIPNASDLRIGENSLPESMEKLQEEIIRKSRLVSLEECQMHLIAKSLAKYPGEFRNRIFEAFAEKITNTIEKDPEFIEEPKPFTAILNIYSLILNFHPKDEARELFETLNSRVFFHHVIKSQSKFSGLDEATKANFLRMYFTISAKLDIFQVAYLDHLVPILNEEMNKKYFRNNPLLLSECVSSLAYLNYPSRFNAKIPHKPLQWNNWQTVLAKTEDFVMGSAISSSYNQETNELETDTMSRSIRNINFLWSMCVIDLYSKSTIQELISEINTHENLPVEVYAKLFQIHYWLKTENHGEFSLGNKLIKSMEKFKEEWDVIEHPDEHTSEIKDMVRNTMQTYGYKFKENHHDFPYFFDFVHTQEKSGIIIDDDSEFLKGTQMQIRSGFHKVMNRQLVNLGWSTKKISIRNWLNVCNSDLLPR